VKETEIKSGWLVQAAANLFPGYFALVMATGIVSIAAHLLGMRALAWALLGINVVAYSLAQQFKIATRCWVQ
jgi:hypothetical protein